jgi:hypothetical protein
MYDLAVENEIEDWYDAVNDRTGTKYECKSTRVVLSNGRPGRFRLWEDQIASLEASDRAGTAWVAFVLLDQGGDVVAVQRRKPSTVRKAVENRGGWNRAGHREREGRQHKLPWPEVVDE